MCEDTKAIERCPKTQRKLIDISLICRRIITALRQSDHDEEDRNGLAERHA